MIIAIAQQPTNVKFAIDLLVDGTQTSSSVETAVVQISVALALPMVTVSLVKMIWSNVTIQTPLLMLVEWMTAQIAERDFSEGMAMIGAPKDGDTDDLLVQSSNAIIVV